MHFTATCATGLEGALVSELHALGMSRIEPGSRAVFFQGELVDGYRACLWSRLASRILLRLGVAYADTAKSLYAEVRRIRWAEHLGPDRTLAVHFIGTSPEIRDARFGALKVKDAVVDAIRDATGDRPSVDLEAPDVRLHVYLERNRAAVSLDLSGDPLHLRGHGRDGGPAPLKETLAAALLGLAGWPERAARGERLVDPMCGSGTFLLEAGDVLLGRAPGLARQRWGFTGWKGHVPATWDGLVREARAAARAPDGVRLFGADRDPTQVARARENLARAGLSAVARVEVRALSEATAPDGPPGLLVTNPPYGERLGDEGEVEATWRLLGDVLRRRFLGWTAFVLAGSTAQARQLGLRPAARIPVRNGALDARWLEVPISAAPVARDAG